MGYAEDKAQREKELAEENLQKVKAGETIFHFRGEQRTKEMCEIAFFKNSIDEYKYIPDEFKTREMTEKYIYSYIARKTSMTGMKFPREHLIANSNELQIKLLSDQAMLMWSVDNFSVDDQKDIELVLKIYIATDENKKKQFIVQYKDITKNKADYTFFDIPEHLLKSLIKNYSDKKLQSLIKLYKD
jgi:hypothetical protein